MNKAELPTGVAEGMKEEATAFSSNTFASSSWDFFPMSKPFSANTQGMKEKKIRTSNTLIITTI